MRFVQFESSGERKVGIEIEDAGEIVDLSAANPDIPSSMRKLLEGGSKNVTAAKNVFDCGKFRIKTRDVKIIAPITQPDKLLCIGMNYRDHCEEQNVQVPVEPVVFNKFPSTIVGPTDDIIYPNETQELDWEVELAVVIGKAGKNIPLADAMNHVFGFTVAHDVSARDWQLRNGGQWLLGKTMDTFCPLGPVIVMKEDILDPQNLNIQCRVNGVTKQNSNTSNIVHKVDSLVCFISRFSTLRPGDVILTGTPPGVGCFRKPPEYLKKGDVVECEIEKIGTIINKIV